MRLLRPPARGKRVPEAEINIQIVQAKKTADKHDFHRVAYSVVLQHDETQLKMI
ncbi:hypothetical protein [Peribacillus frigoritolerans]|uniref:hypothetical protein n=1 Tax=Peribacillus frigoritolerans TaxID=450367 RepID=UPI002B2430D3|nr:hypothetical protein [Peribacillus frigoritolerans]MEB2630325.1 hypothetical protein [Peribacillus frigoritolerans]